MPSLESMFEDVETVDELTLYVNTTIVQCVAAEMPARLDLVFRSYFSWVQKLNLYITICVNVRDWAQRMDNHFETHVADSLIIFCPSPEAWYQFHQFHHIQLQQMQCMCERTPDKMLLALIEGMDLIKPQLLAYARTVEIYKDIYEYYTQTFGASSRPSSPMPS